MTSVSTPANRQRARTRPPSPRSRTYAAGFLAAIVIAIFIAVFLQSPHQAAEAQTSTVLVKNTGQTIGSGNYKLTSTNHSRAQQFTTGDNTSGYMLDSIGILFHAISNIATAGAHLTVTLNEVSNGNPASSVLCTLTDPNAFTASGVQTFAAPATDPCPTLTPNTPYFFVIKRVQHVTTDVISLKATSGTDEDHTAAMGWSIGNDRHFIGTSNTWSSIPSQPYLIEVTGTTLASYTVPLNWPLKPHGLVGGDQFRLLFVTSTTSDATSENIATYNTFVRTVAESGHDAIQAYSPGFTAIASTAATDARDNTGTTYTNDDKGVPIYWVGGANLAVDYADFYDGSWNNEDKAKDESGSVRSTTDVSDYPFTGSDHDGTERFAALVSEAMGSSNTNVAIGRPNSSTTSGDGPLSGAMQTTAKTNSRPLYALSQVFTIDNAETTILETTITVESFGNVSGYSILYLLGDIQDPSFSYKGRTGTIREVTTSALEGETEFLLGIPGFFTDVDRDTAILTNWSLHVGDTAFADDAGNDHFDGEIYGWTQLPSTWNDNDVITIRLLTTEPSAPTSLTAVDNDPNGTTVTLTWTAPTTGGSAITKYQYRHSGIEPDTHSEWTDIPGGGTITTADVTFPVGWPDGPYQFNVRAFNDDGDGLWSEPAYATVFDERGLTVSNTSQTVNSQVYTLTDSSDLPSRAQQFTTGKNPAGYTLESASAKFNSITNTGTVGAQLAVTLNATASGAPSSTALCTLTDPGTFATSGVHTFTAPTTDLCPALTPSTEYFIVVTRVEHVAADVIALDATASTDQDEASAANWTIGNSRHFYGSSNTWSSTASEPHLIAVTAKSLPNAPNAPDAPSVQATPGTTNSLNVSWPAPANIGNPVITDFDLQYQQVGTTTWTEWPHVGTALSTNITPLNPGTSYRVQLRATNAAGTSPWSRPRQAPTDAPPAKVPSNWPLIPTGLSPGSKFRLIFATSTTRDATSTDINDYNTFAQTAAAAGHTDIRKYSSSFAVVGSTSSIHARDNTVTAFTATNKGVPIYWLAGAKAADNYQDFYDGSWDDESNTKDESGNTRSLALLANRPFTGTEHNGTEAFTYDGHSTALGAATVQLGTPNRDNSFQGPLSGSHIDQGSDSRPFYALSQVFEVAPNNFPTGAPTVTGTPRVGEILTADTSGIQDLDGLTTPDWTYQWTRVDGDDDTNIGTDSTTYSLTDDDANKTVKVKVTFTDDIEIIEGPLASEPTATIVPADVLVRNTSRTSDSSQGLTNSRQLRAQAFTTGAAEDGYKLHAIGFLFNSIASTTTAGSHLTATLNEETSGDPGNVLCTLTDPTSFTSSGLHSFTAPTSGTKCPTLTANTTYFAVINRVTVTSDAITLQLTNSSGEDPGSVAGFSVGNDRHHSQTGTTWSDVSGQSYQIEVKGDAATVAITSDHTTWVDNREGDADTDYENLGSYSIAQGFRTGDTAGIFNVNEIHIDFDSGQTEYQKILLLITESTTPDAEVNTGTPSGFRKGGSFYSQEVDSDGTVTFPRHSGYKWLEANTNYFLIISSTSNDPNAAPTLRMTEHEGQDSSDGWSIDDQSYSKAKTDGARWTRQDHQVRFRISGEYHQGLSLYLEPTKYESCPNKPCVIAVLETDENMGMEGRRFPGSLDSTTTWISTQENMEFRAALWPIPTSGQWVEFDYSTKSWTATAGEDFHNTHGTVRFSAGDKLKTIKVELIDDSIEDSGEQLRMSIARYLNSNTAGYNTGDLKVKTGGGYPFPEVTKYSAFGTILNSEEETETRWLKVSGATITEGVETAAQFTVSLTGTLTAPVWFNYATVDGSAVAGTHYTATSGETHIPHGATSVTVSVPILDFDDDVYTGNRQFTLQLSNITVAAVGTDSATATIKDDDPQPLTASFTNLPPGHDGENAFKFDISFNQDVATQRLVMQEDVMTVTNGAITGAGRVDGAKSRWRITVEPVDGRDVTVELPATTDCSATGAVCTGGDNPQPLSNGITHTFPGTKLNAEFEGFDFYHDGSTPMQFRLVFSKEVDTTAAEIKDHALTVTGATINTVVQKDEGSTRRWNFSVTPAGTGPFDVILAAATDCALDGHICTADGELLAQGDWKRSSGPPVISVADAAVTEGDGAQLAFAVTLDRNWSGPIPTVSYATSDGTASAGSDYTAGSGSLTLGWTHTGSLIRPWTLAGTITVPVTNDTVVEETETLTLTLSSPIWATLGDATATGTIEEDDVAVVREPDSAPTGLPVITGTPEADSALTADTSAIDDANGLTEVSYSYQWIVTTDGADADIEGATTSTYTPRAAHVGKTFKVSVSFTDDDDYQHTLTSGPTTPITRNTDAIVWSADMLVVEYTAVSIGAASADLFSNIGGTGSLQIKSLWSYVPDSDLRLAFTDTFDDAEDHTLIVGDLTLEFPAGSSGEQSFKWTNAGVDWTDGETIAVSIVPTTPAEPTPNTTATGEPTISGTPQVGERLTAGTADIGDADGLENVSYNYQWLAGDANIQHATGSAHTLTDDDEGKTIKVKVSFTDDAGNAESLTSQATTAVDPRPNRPASGAPSIQGVLQDQQVLTADSVGIADADGLENATISYQWMRVADGDAVDITGATSSTYTLTSTDVGDSIQLQAAFADDRERAESVTSAVTDAVVASGATRELLWLSTMTPEDPDGLDDGFQLRLRCQPGKPEPSRFHRRRRHPRHHLPGRVIWQQHHSCARTRLRAEHGADCNLETRTP